MAEVSRRYFLYVIGVLASIVALLGIRPFWKKDYEGCMAQSKDSTTTGNNLGVASNGKSYVYITKNGSPEKNTRKAIEMIGGIEKFIGKNDIVLLKPNAQWWNQGTTNTNIMKAFIELVLEIPGFDGEVIIAENHHFKEKESRGWTTTQRNGKYNLNELVNFFNEKGYNNITKYHWCDAGPNPNPMQGNAGNGKIVKSPEAGDGYVWMEDAVYVSKENRKCMMTYPVFTSLYSGRIIDLKNGIYHEGNYVNNLRLINFSCLNHHGKTFGVTASTKNLMGIVDLTCGYHGTKPEGFYNAHYVGKESPLHLLGTRLKYYGRRLHVVKGIGQTIQSHGTFNGHYTGGALGYWMKTVRMPDLHILAAEYIGWGSRVDTQKRSKIKTVAISNDPVALDYIGAKKILLPATPMHEKYYRDLNDPEKPPFRLFLEECHKQGIGTLNEENIKVIESS